jgi:hypothetical protein
MNTEVNIDDRLWNYIDGLAEGEEKSAIEHLIENNIEWRRKYSELLEVHQLLHSSELEEPSMRFTKNVMEEIAKYHIAPATKSYINKRIIYSIGAFFVLMIIGFLIYGFGQIDWSASGTISNPASQYIDRVEKVDFSKFFNNTYINIAMMVNIVLGLGLLDWYLTNKKKEMHKHA